MAYFSLNSMNKNSYLQTGIWLNIMGFLPLAPLFFSRALKVPRKKAVRLRGGASLIGNFPQRGHVSM